MKKQNINTQCPDINAVYAEGTVCEEGTAASVTDRSDGLAVMRSLEADLCTCLSDYEKVHKELAILLLGADRSESNMGNLLYRKFEDLLIVPVIFRELGEGCRTAVKIRGDWTDIWNVDREKVISDAIENAANVLPPSFGLVSKALLEITGNEDDEAPWSGAEMYFLTNVTNLYGASAIFYPFIPWIITEELKSDFFILPSSVHEVIILPDHGEDPGELAGIVKEINRTVVSPQEILTDSVYHYRQSDCRIRRVC